jgi:malate dehydrogenase (oxaloacetate-decarboxylating)
LNYMNPLEYHKQLKGKIEVISRAQVQNREDLALAYTPGVAEPCKAIAADKSKVYDYTRKGNMVAVITDGSAVLGLGDIGPEASLPVMEGKAVLFKQFAGVDAFPIAIRTQDVDEFVRTVELISPMFGGINLEDISAPRCFEIEDRLKELLDIPVFHDDQHGTAIVVLAALYNALKIVNKDIGDIRVVFSGVGAAGVAIAKLLHLAGVTKATFVDSKGIIYAGREEGMNDVKASLLELYTNQAAGGTLADALVGADVFVGVSQPNLVTKEMVESMNPEAIIFAMANPVPEIMPDVAHAAGAAVVATGRSDFPNQINNVLAFPGIFKGVLEARVQNITDDMKLGTARAIADLVEVPTAERIIPDPFDERVVPAVVKAVKQSA